MNEDKVREMAANVARLLEVHKKQHELMKKLLGITLKHLKDRRRLIPKEAWDERQELIAALEQITTEDEHDRGRS